MRRPNLTGIEYGIIATVCAILAVLIMSGIGCSKSLPKSPETAKDAPARFELVAKEGNGMYVRVLLDTKTGREYLVVKDGYGVAIAPMGGN